MSAKGRNSQPPNRVPRKSRPGIAGKCPQAPRARLNLNARLVANNLRGGRVPLQTRTTSQSKPPPFPSKNNSACLAVAVLAEPPLLGRILRVTTLIEVAAAATPAKVPGPLTGDGGSSGGGGGVALTFRFRDNVYRSDGCAVDGGAGVGVVGELARGPATAYTR